MGTFLASLLATATHTVLGTFRLILVILGIFLSLLKIVWLSIRIIVRAVAHLYTKGYPKTKKYFYSWVGNPVCEICGKTKTWGRRVVYHDSCCNRWVHQDCHTSEMVAGKLYREDFLGAAFTTAAAQKVFRQKNPLNLSVLIGSLRKRYNDPNQKNLFLMVYATKREATAMLNSGLPLSALKDVIDMINIFDN